MSHELEFALRLVIAAVVGLGVGVERQWSGHSTGDQARFAGMRTFTLLGTVGGIAGLLLAAGFAAAGAAAVAGAMALTVAAYVMTVRRAGADHEGTTEVAALVVTALGALAGIGQVTLAAGTGAVVVLALHEKERLHGVVANLRQEELRAALRFGVLALVVLPLLPTGPVLGALAIRPRALWVIVLFFSALNFAAFVLRRAAGAGRGYGVVGMLGGLISSTAVTLDFARRSRSETGLARSLASGVIGACTVLIPRVLVVSAAFNPAVTMALVWYLAPALGVGALFVLRDWRHIQGAEASDVASAGPQNPLRLVMAIKMALLFQVAMTAIEHARELWAAPGLFATATVLGLTDVDALTVGMSRAGGPAPELAARAIAVGILANTVFKLALALTIGSRPFRTATAVGLLAIGAAIGVALLA